MTATSGAPWSVTVDYSHDLAFALAVRDALGLEDPLGLPPVEPPLPLTGAAGVVGDDEVAARWHAWWELASGEPGHASRAALALDGPLDALVRANSDGLLRWSSDRKRELARLARSEPGRPRARVADALRAHEEATGARIGAFRLTVIALPVAGAVFVPNGPEVVLAGLGLLRDRAAYLTAVVDHVAHRAGWDSR